jgi:hypothetical protein
MNVKMEVADRALSWLGLLGFVAAIFAEAIG